MAAAADSIDEKLASVGTGRLSLEQIDVPAVNKAPSSTPSTEDMTEADLEAQPPGHEVIKHETPLHRTVTAQDWAGPDDPENPWNWPSWKKVYHTSIPAFMGLAATLGSSVYTPGLPDIMAEFHISSEVALLGLALWVLGLGFGPVLAAPLSETQGRRAVYRLSLPISAVFTLGAGFAQSPAALMVLRFFGGMFASPVLAVGAGTLADLYTPLYRAPATVMFIASPFAGPALGPVIGGFTVEAKGWRWTQWVILMFIAAAMAHSLPMSETHKKTILKKRAKRLNLDPPRQQGPTGVAALKMMLVITVFRPIHMLFTEPIVGFFSLYIAFNFSVLFAFFDAFPIVFQGVYGFDRGHAGLIWLAVLLGVFLGVISFIALDRYFYRPRYLASMKEGRGGVVAPEHRLYPAMVGSLGLPIGLFWLGWTARADISWASPAIAAIPFAWGNICVFSSCAMYLVDTYGQMSGASAMAANGLLRYTFGSVFPLFTNQMYANLGIGWATSIFGFIAIGLLPIPWILYKFGSAIRGRSQYDTIKA